MNLDIQIYKGIPIRMTARDCTGIGARRFRLNETNQNVWIPKKHLFEDGTLKEGECIDYVFLKAQNQLKYAGYELYFRKLEG